MPFQVIPTNLGNEYGASSEKMAAAYAALLMEEPTTNLNMSIELFFSDGTEKVLSNEGSRAMKETTAYMMTDMMKTVFDIRNRYKCSNFCVYPGWENWYF